MFNLKTLGYKAAGIYDATYNPASGQDILVVNDETPVLEIIEHLAGADGLYDLSPLRDFMTGLTGDEGELLCRVLGVGESSVDLMYYIEKIFGPEKEDLLSWAFVGALFKSYNGRDPLMLDFFQLYCLEYQGAPIDFTGVLHDCSSILHAADFQPGSRLFGWVYKILAVIVNG